MSTKLSEQALRIKRATKAADHLLVSLGYDMEHQDIKDTPARVAKLLASYVDPGPAPELRTFPASFASMVTVVDHRAYTKCPHHLETVEMDVSVAYLPNGKVLGISKLPRTVDFLSKGLMLQEEIAEAIAEGLMNALNPLGVAVFIQGRHMCVRSRGVKSYNSDMVTTVVRGLYKEDVKAREEFFSTIQLVRMTRR
jgi:GTP cyclohydrolase I